MKEPRRLIDGEASAFERELLSSWKREQPSARARAAVLGLTTTAGVGCATMAKAATAGNVAASKASLAFGTWTVAKAIVVGALAGIVTVTAVEIAGITPRPPADRRAASGPVLLPSAKAPSSASPEAIAGHEPRESPTPVDSAGAGAAPTDTAPTKAPVTSTIGELGRLRRPSAQASAAPTRAFPPEDGTVEDTSSLSAPRQAPRSSLREELVAVERARAALAEGNVQKALAGVDAYDAEFPSGTLAQEALVLRIEALVKLGRRDEATRLGSAFVLAHPTSAHVEKIRGLIHP